MLMMQMLFEYDLRLLLGGYEFVLKLWLLLMVMLVLVMMLLLLMRLLGYRVLRCVLLRLGLDLNLMSLMRLRLRTLCSRSRCGRGCLGNHGAEKPLRVAGHERHGSVWLIIRHLAAKVMDVFQHLKN
jgi:hypothetical protein